MVKFSDGIQICSHESPGIHEILQVIRLSEENVLISNCSIFHIFLTFLSNEIMSNFFVASLRHENKLFIKTFPLKPRVYMYLLQAI